MHGTNIERNPHVSNYKRNNMHRLLGQKSQDKEAPPSPLARMAAGAGGQRGGRPVMAQSQVRKERKGRALVCSGSDFFFYLQTGDDA